MKKIEIQYKTAEGKRIPVSVTEEVNELLTQSDREIRSQRRQDKRRLSEYIEGVSETSLVLPREDSADLLVREEENRALYEAMTHLTETQLRRLVLYYAYNFSYRKIATIEKVNDKSVFESVDQALKKLRKYLNL